MTGVEVRHSLRNRLCAVILIVASSSAIADSGGVTADVSTVLIDDALFGGCMIKLSQDINDRLPACAEDWVTLDCLAAFPESTKSGAQTKLSLAQLAFVANKQIYVAVTDTRKANGYCFATRLEINQ